MFARPDFSQHPTTESTDHGPQLQTAELLQQQKQVLYHFYIVPWEWKLDFPREFIFFCCCVKSPRIILVQILLTTQQLQWISSIIFIFNQETHDYCCPVGRCYQWKNPISSCGCLPRNIYQYVTVCRIDMLLLSEHIYCILLSSF